MRRRFRHAAARCALAVALFATIAVPTITMTTTARAQPPSLTPTPTPNPLPSRRDGGGATVPVTVATPTKPVAVAPADAMPARTVPPAPVREPLAASAAPSVATPASAPPPRGETTADDIPRVRQPAAPAPAMRPPPRSPAVAGGNTPAPRPGTRPGVDASTPYNGDTFMRGVNYVSYDRSGIGYTADNQLAQVIVPSGAGWVSIIPSCYQDANNSTAISCDANVNNDTTGGKPGGYTPRDVDVESVVVRAHAAGLKVMLKPQIEVRDGFRGTIGFGTNDTQWRTWFASYRTQVLGRYGRIARDFGVEYFVVGTELQDSNRVADTTCDGSSANAAQRGADWRDATAYLRNTVGYTGSTTYAANWGVFDCAEVLTVNWWNALTTIGVDAYYPLTNAPNPDDPNSLRTAPLPSVAQLVASWTDDNATADANYSGRLGRFVAPVNSLRTLSEANGNKKIIFTEIGYQSQRGTTAQPFGIYLTPEQGPYFDEQTNATQAAFLAFAGQPWLAGMFWWATVAPYFDPATDNNYLFYGKPAGIVITDYYRRMRPNPAPVPRPAR